MGKRLESEIDTVLDWCFCSILLELDYIGRGGKLKNFCLLASCHDDYTYSGFLEVI